jgi:predicted esterase YcpF (UPF0227 family)
VSQPTIIYLHGFRSSPASVKARLLQDARAALPPSQRPWLHVPALDHRPAQAIALILDLSSRVHPAALTFVGSSLGGFYATCAAERLRARAVVVNPAVRPYEDLAPYRGRQVNLYTGAQFDVTDAHFAELRALAVTRIREPSRYLLLAQTGDEVLDYREAVSFYAGAWQWLQGGGGHAFRNFEAVIPAILRFATPGNTAFGRAAPWGHP